MTTYFGSFNGNRYEENDLFDQSINQDHNYRPSFHFFGKRESRHYGIELEMDVHSHMDKQETAKRLLMGVNKEHRHFYIKRDGSLRRGFEFNSMPMTVNYMEDTFDESFMNQLLTDNGTFITEDCGFHVHISRANFVDQHASYKFTQSLLNLNLYLLYLSNRKSIASVNRYANFFSTDPALRKTNQGNVQSLIKVGRTSKRLSIKDSARLTETMLGAQRYSAINNTNQNTLEVRIFKGTLSWSHVMNVMRTIDFLVDISNQGEIIYAIEDFVRHPLLSDKLKTFTELTVKQMIRGMRALDDMDKAKRVFDFGEGINRSYMDGAYYRVSPTHLVVGDLLILNNLMEQRLEIDDTEDSLKDSIGRMFERAYEVLSFMDDGIDCVTTSNDMVHKFIDSKDAKKNYVALRMINSSLDYKEKRGNGYGILKEIVNKKHKINFPDPNVTYDFLNTYRDARVNANIFRPTTVSVDWGIIPNWGSDPIADHSNFNDFDEQFTTSLNHELSQTITARPRPISLNMDANISYSQFLASNGINSSSLAETRAMGIDDDVVEDQAPCMSWTDVDSLGTFALRVRENVIGNAIQRFKRFIVNNTGVDDRFYARFCEIFQMRGNSIYVRDTGIALLNQDFPSYAREYANRMVDQENHVLTAPPRLMPPSERIREDALYSAFCNSYRFDTYSNQFVSTVTPTRILNSDIANSPMATNFQRLAYDTRSDNFERIEMEDIAPDYR